MIKPEAIPQYTGDLALLETAYGDLKTDASHIRSTGKDVHSQFQGLAAYYTAPEAEQLFASTKPVADRADGFADDLEKVSGALSSYGTEIRPLVDKLKQLKIDATNFVSSVKDDDDWEYDEDKIDKHNKIRDDVTATVAAFWAAERTCHNAITKLFGGTQMVAGDGSDRKDQYGFNADDLKNAKLPWGDPVEEKHHVWEVGHWVKSFVWDGLIVDGVWGTIKGLGTLVGFGGWDAMGQAWKGLAQLATGLAISSIPGASTLFWTLPDDKLPSWLRDSRTAMKETGKALVAWDEWGKNPGRAAGAVTFNVLTTVFTGGAGGAAAGAGKAGAVAKVLSVAGKAGKFIDPMTYIAKGAGAGLSKIGDIAKGLKGIGNIEIPKLPDNAITLPEGALKLPDGSVHIPEGAAIPEGAVKLPDGNFQLPHDTPAFPEGTTKLPTEPGAPAQYLDPKGNILDHQGNVVDNVDHAPTDVVDKPTGGNPAAGSDVPHTPSPVKEPALVGAGSHTADNAAHVGDNAGQTVRLGDSLDNDLGDVGRTGDNVPGGQAGHDLPGGNAGDHLPGGTAGDHLPGGRADDLGTGPSASHEPPAGHTGGHGEGTGTGGGHDGASTGGHSDAPGTGSHTDVPAGGGHEQGSGAGDGPGGHGTDGPTGSDGADAPRANEPLAELTPEERASQWRHLEEVEGRSADDFDELQRDPDKNGGISEPSKDEARVGLDLREQERLPDDIQRPTEADRGEFYSPSTGEYYDIKGVHSDWPPFNNVRDKSLPFRGAYDPTNNGRWVSKLSEQIVTKKRTVILDVRNANQAAIDDIKAIVEKNGWGDNVIWYP
ncbi:type II toxin-antitoxin system Phd/YefM family antitoxin [Streptomyces avermitilis]